MERLTSLPGVPDKSDAVPGMAYFRNTGPFATFCGGCRHRGYFRVGKTGKSRKVMACAKYRELSGRHGPVVDRYNGSCKYFQT